MTLRTGGRLTSAFAALVLVVSGCSVSADTSVGSADAPSPSQSTEDDSTIVESVGSDTAPTTTPVAPEPVTASTEHASRSDDFPDVLAAQATPEGNDAWRFDVTLSSPYDSAARYADAWRVVGPDGTEYGIRVLTHDHASEQPFTRSQSGIVIPADVDTVTVEGRDQANGWGGGTLEVRLR